MPTKRGDTHELCAQGLLLRDRIVSHVVALDPTEYAHMPLYVRTLIECVKLAYSGMLDAQKRGYVNVSQGYRRVMYNNVYEIMELFE